MVQLISKLGHSMRLLRHWKMMIGLARLFMERASSSEVVVLLILVAVHNPSPESLDRWANYRFNEYEKRLRLDPL